MKKVLFVSTQNACRGQMAEGIVNPTCRPLAFSTGTNPSEVNPNADEIIAVIRIDISRQRSKHLDEFTGKTFGLDAGDSSRIGRLRVSLS